MRQKIINHEEENFLLIVNQNVRICLVCGDDRIESHEFGMSCEECGTSFGRRKC